MPVVYRSPVKPTLRRPYWRWVTNLVVLQAPPASPNLSPTLAQQHMQHTVRLFCLLFLGQESCLTVYGPAVDCCETFLV